MLDWSIGTYNPRVDVTKETTSLYASDRDLFLFLVDDLNPIEAGQLPDGSPDLYFQGVRQLELGGGRQDARHRQLLHARVLPEPEPLGRRGLPGDHGCGSLETAAGRASGDGGKGEGFVGSTAVAPTIRADITCRHYSTKVSVEKNLSCLF